MSALESSAAQVLYSKADSGLRGWNCGNVLQIRMAYCTRFRIQSSFAADLPASDVSACIVQRVKASTSSHLPAGR